MDKLGQETGAQGAEGTEGGEGTKGTKGTEGAKDSAGLAAATITRAAGSSASPSIGHTPTDHSKEFLARIAVALIDTAPQMRTVFDGIETFAERLRAEGLQQPITVTETASGRYLLVTGERRLRAAQLLQWDTIPAFIHEPLSRESFLTMQWSENESRENLSSCDRTQAILAVIAEVGIDRARIVLGNRSKAWVAKYNAFNGFPDQARCLLEAGLCGDIEILTTIAHMEFAVADHLASKAPHDQWTFKAFDDALAAAQKGALSQAHAKQQLANVLDRMKWAIQGEQRRIEQTEREEAAQAERGILSKAQREQQRLDEKAAKSDPVLAAQLIKEKAQRKAQRAEQAQANREQGYRFRLSQAGQAGRMGEQAARKVIEDAGERETEERLLFLLFQCVRNTVAPILASLEPKRRKAFLRCIADELGTGAPGNGAPSKYKESSDVTPPRGWVVP
jgi:ParB/RepB/Spo0J family partition protein